MVGSRLPRQGQGKTAWSNGQGEIRGGFSIQGLLVLLVLLQEEDTQAVFFAFGGTACAKFFVDLAHAFEAGSG